MQKDSHQKEFLTPQDTADLLGVTVGTLAIWRSSGRYNLSFVKVGSRVRYRLRDINAFLRRRTVSFSTGEA